MLAARVRFSLSESSFLSSRERDTSLSQFRQILKRKGRFATPPAYFLNFTRAAATNRGERKNRDEFNASTLGRERRVQRERRRRVESSARRENC